MKHAFALAGLDELLLSSQVLRALEEGRLPMHARDYLDTATWLKRELAHRSSAQLRQLKTRLSAAAGPVIDAVLHERGEPCEPRLQARALDRLLKVLRDES